MFETAEEITILGADLRATAAHRGYISYIDGKPFFNCPCGIQAPIRADVLAAIDDMATHYRMVGA